MSVVIMTTPIYEIQGDGPSSPLVGQTVVTEGIVTGDFQDDNDPTRNLRGFYIQDETGDDRLETSDGVFVFESSLIEDVEVGDKVRITGTVSEFFGETQIAPTIVEIIGSGSIDATPITLPTESVIENADGTLILDIEEYEGMLVTFPEDLTVTDSFTLGRFGDLRLSQGGRLFQYTNSNAPDTEGFAEFSEEIASRTIVLDDGLTIQNPETIIYPPPELASDNTVRMGDKVKNLTGNVRFSRGSGGNGDEIYRIMPAEIPEFEVVNPRPDTPEAVGGDLKVGVFNVENLFTTLNANNNTTGPGNTFTPRGPRTAEESERQIERLVTTIDILDADIVGLTEVENNGFETVTAGNANQSAISTLVEELNQVSDDNYAFVDPGVDFVGTDAIQVGLIYKTDKVELAPGTTVEILTDADLASLGDLGLSGEPVFDGPATSRAPLAATFQDKESGEAFTVSVAHLKSKGSSGLTDTEDPNFDQLDGQGFWNFRRTEASIAVDAWLDTQPTGTDDPDTMIIGDFNAYIEEDPLTYLESQDYTALLRNITGSEPYSFVFRGQAGALDHAFSNPSLTDQVSGITEWHINSDEPTVLNYSLAFGRDPELFDGSIPFRSSDHDVLLVGLDLGEETNIINGTPRRDVLVGTDGNDIITGFGSPDNITGGAGNDIFVYRALRDRRDIITDFESGSDLVDLVEVLESVNYTGADPIADGVVGFTSRRNNTVLTIDADGSLGASRSRPLILFSGVNLETISNPDNFIFSESVV